MNRISCVVSLLLLVLIPMEAHTRIIASSQGSILSARAASSRDSHVKVVLNQRIPVPVIQGHSAIDLDATVLYRDDKPRPTIIIATPYRRELWVLLYYALVDHGYNFVSVDMRGTGESFGQWAVLGQEDATDIAYIIDQWIPAQPWSDGKVGMMGPSYMGENELMAAGNVMLAPDGTPVHLKAILPLVPLADPYSDFLLKGGNCHWLGVIVFFGGVDFLSMFPTSLLFGTLTPPLPGMTRMEVIYALMRAHVMNFPLHFVDWMGDPANYDKSELWRSRTTLLYWPDTPQGIGYDLPPGAHAIPPKVPVMDVAGWWCILERGELNNYQYGLARHAPGDKALIVGPWYHIDGGFGMGLCGFFLTQHIAVRWFDWKIRGVNDPFMVTYPVMLYVMGADRWRAEKAWPLASSRVDRMTWYLSKQPASMIPGDFFSTANEPDNYLLSEQDTPLNYSGEDPVLHHDPAALHGLVSRSSTRAVMGLPAEYAQYSRLIRGIDIDRSMPWEDERSDEVGVLTFTTETLERDVEIAGPLRLTFWAKTAFLPHTGSSLGKGLSAINYFIPDNDFPLTTEYPYRRDVQWVVEVNDVQPDGRARNMTSGWLAASHRPYNPQNPTEVDPGYVPFSPFYDMPDVTPDLIRENTLYHYTIEIWPTDVVFKKGHRVRISLSGSDFPHLLPFVTPSDNTIQIDQDHKATLDFTQVNTKGEGSAWKWVDSGTGTIAHRFDEANEYLLTHKN